MSSYISISTQPQANPVLSKLSVGFPNDGHIADEVCPPIDVGEDKEQGNYPVWDKYNLQSNIDDLRSIKGDSNEVDNQQATLTTYSCDAHSLANTIDPRTFKQHRHKELHLAARRQETLLSLLLLKKENRVATLFTTAANYASANKKTLTGSDRWSDPISSPEAEIETQREVVALSGMDPNTIAMGINRWRTMRQHPEIRALIKNTDSHLLTDDMVPPKLWGLKLEVAGSRNVTSKQGSTETIARLWGNFVWMGYVNKTPNPIREEPTFAYKFRAAGRVTETFQQRKNEILDVQEDISVNKITLAASGFLWTTPF